MNILHFNNPYRGYIQPTSLKGNRLAICTKRIVNISPFGTHTRIDCGKSVGFEEYIVKEPLHVIQDMLIATQSI